LQGEAIYSSEKYNFATLLLLPVMSNSGPSNGTEKCPGSSKATQQEASMPNKKRRSVDMGTFKAEQKESNFATLLLLPIKISRRTNPLR
jgi:hypothetical protein